jgi:hypothetical protein
VNCNSGYQGSRLCRALRDTRDRVRRADVSRRARQWLERIAESRGGSDQDVGTVGVIQDIVCGGNDQDFPRMPAVHTR